jgi:hypothetical protein
LKRVPLSENKKEDKGMNGQGSVESLILATFPKDDLSDAGFGGFLNSACSEEGLNIKKSSYSYDPNLDKQKQKQFKFRDPIIEGGGKFSRQKSLEL